MNTRADAAAASNQPSKHLRPVIMAGGIGNVIEWFDYVTYAFMATTLGTLFFPNEDKSAQLISVFAIFAVAYFARPVGGVILGALGDKIGRKRILEVIIFVMAAGTALIGLLPTYASIGIMAPILLFLLRIVQGLVVGGEWAGVSTFVVEHAPDHKRAFISSALPVGSAIGIMLGSVVVAILTAVMSDETFTSWGWRLPFLVALPLGIIGVYLRYKTEDAPVFKELRESQGVSSAPVSQALRTNGGRIFALAAYFITNAAGYYIVFTYLPTFFQTHGHVSTTMSLVSNIVAMCVFCCFIPIYALISDKVGRRPLMMNACILFLILTIPALWITGLGGITYLILGQILLALALASTECQTSVLLAEPYPTAVRYTSGAFTYNFTYAIFGGTAPLVSTFLVESTGSSYAPGLYIMGLAVISLIVTIFFIPETYRLSMKR